jgi:hypothetical protein
VLEVTFGRRCAECTGGRGKIRGGSRSAAAAVVGKKDMTSVVVGLVVVCR